MTTNNTSIPIQPIASFVQEADNLYTWCLQDIKALEPLGISAKILEELRLRAAACREAEALWNQHRNTQSEARKQWKQLVPEARALRNELLSQMRFAFRKAPHLRQQLADISKGNGYADLIQDLNDIALLGRQQSDVLQQSVFDTSLLDLAADKSKELAELWASTKARQAHRVEYKQQRNKAFWHLHELVNEIRTVGKFVFRNDESRRKGYVSSYWEAKNKRKTKSKPPKNTTE